MCIDDIIRLNRRLETYTHVEEETFSAIAREVAKDARIMVYNREVRNANAASFVINALNNFTPSRFDHVY